jgi:exodeoxyribonuclease VII large subunit
VTDLFSAAAGQNADRPAARPPDRPTALSVSQLVSELRRAVESATGTVWIKGEVAGFKAYGNGHWYFSLRDPESSIKCVMWKSNTAKVGAAPSDGTEVYALVTPTVWAEKGELKAAVQVMLPTAGVGIQQLNREKIRAALEKDGLLDPARKRPLPAFPRAIAVVTSADGAAVRDIIIVTRKRWGSVRLLVVGATVQGDGAARDLCRALRLVNRLTGIDLCIVGRGGGSKEDLSAFDDEKVCRAVAALAMPVISAVGHETDASLTDLVADFRAATPSAAAELAVPDRVDCVRHVASLASRLAHGLRRRTGLITERLARSGDRIEVAMTRRIQGPRVLLDRYAGQLEALSPLKVLGRGYSVARLADGRVARRRADLPPGTDFTLKVSDGEVSSRSQ